MSTVREEDERKNNNCPSRGLGLAAAAIGVGLGAALYYYFSKRPENPDNEGSTSSWRSEEMQAFHLELDEGIQEEEDSNSYSTISEHSTTDTSVHDREELTNMSHPNSETIPSDSESERSQYDSSQSEEGNISETENYSESSENNHRTSHSSAISVNSSETSDNESQTSGSNSNISSDSSESSESDIEEWDVTSSSADVPISIRQPLNRIDRLLGNLSSLMTTNRYRTRERSWSLEECSICMEVILQGQQVSSLPCSHHFHTSCVEPWLREQQTCPNCRKAAN